MLFERDKLKGESLIAPENNLIDSDSVTFI